MEKEIIEKLDRVIELGQLQFIIEAKKSGMTSEEVRKILGISNNKLFEIWKLIKINDK